MPFDGTLPLGFVNKGQRYRQLLELAKSFIDTPDKWTQKIYTQVDDDGSIRRCAVGALYTAGIMLRADMTDTRRAAFILSSVIQPSGNSMAGTEAYLAAFNDNSSHAAVMKLFDGAIGLLRNRMQEDQHDGCRCSGAAYVPLTSP